MKKKAKAKPSLIQKPKNIGDDAERLFDNIAEEILRGDRELFDNLSQHEQQTVIQWLSDALVDGNAFNAVHDVLW